MSGPVEGEPGSGGGVGEVISNSPRYKYNLWEKKKKKNMTCAALFHFQISSGIAPVVPNPQRRLLHFFSGTAVDPLYGYDYVAV